MADRKQLLHEALKLSPDQRAALVDDLIESLDEVEDKHVQAAWDAEIARRVAELDSGKVGTVAWEDVRRKLRGIVRDAGDQAA